MNLSLSDRVLRNGSSLLLLPASVSERAQAIRDQTGAACVAWEGSGAARAALFNGIGSLEIRAVTDAADKEAPQRFHANLPIAMANLASLLRLWLE